MYIAICPVIQSSNNWVLENQQKVLENIKLEVDA